MGLYASNASGCFIIQSRFGCFLAKDVTMQVVAARANTFSGDVPEDEKAKEKEIIMTQLAKEGKPADLQEKIAMEN